jgi:hypothetical protein
MQPKGLIVSTALSVVLSSSIGLGQTLPPLRGVYPLGMNSLNAGLTPEPGLSYSNLFLFYLRNKLKGSNGEVVSTGNNSVLMDLNTFVWVSQKTILGGANGPQNGRNDNALFPPFRGIQTAGSRQAAQLR